MAALTPQFTDTFSVPTGDYASFISLVRHNVTFHCSSLGPERIIVLPPEQKDPTLWFHVVLRTRKSSLTLAVRLDNLYLVGFKTPDSGGVPGVWWEFNNDDNKHLIPNSRWLGFGGRYAQLIGHHQKPGLHSVTLGRAEMAGAVDALAELGGDASPAADSYALPKSKLVKLVMMVCEGLRFHTVSRTVSSTFDHAAATMTEVEGRQVQEWDKISGAVLTWAKDEKAKISDMDKIGIKDKNHALTIVALVKAE
ncbi:hypothetical protein ACP70R_045526 [Stipagrostis hirtigluma subsp. patula]